MEVTIRQVPAQPDIQEQQEAWLFHGTKYSVEMNPMKKVTIFVSLLLLLFLTACDARSNALDAQKEAQPQAEVSLPVDISGLPEGQCYRQMPYLNPIGISYPEGQCVWNDKVYSFSNAPAKLGVTDANGNSEALELPDAEFIYSVCETGDTLALLAGANPLFFAGTDDEQFAQASSDGGHAIYLYDETGHLTGSIPLAECSADAPYELDSNGTDYFVLFSDTVVRVGADGTELAKSGDIGGRLLQLVCADGAVFGRVEGDAIYQTEKIVRLNAQTLETETELSCDGLDIQGIPAYMIDIPRGEYKAKLYYDDFIFPIMTGKVIEFYCNDDSRYVFRSNHMMIVAILKREKLAHFEIGFQVLDQTVDARVAAFSTIEKCLRSKSLRISIENTKNISISLPIRSPGKRWPRKQQLLAMLEFWTFGLSKLKKIEEYYEIKFKLAPLSGSDKVLELYDSIVFVYNGIMLNENCDITLPSSSFDDDIVIEEPFLCQENEPIPLQDRVIHGITFRPYRSAFLPCKISLSEIKKGDIVRLPGCCEYRIVVTK